MRNMTVIVETRQWHTMRGHSSFASPRSPHSLLLRLRVLLLPLALLLQLLVRDRVN